MTIIADQATEALCVHAEGAVWSSSWGGLRWVDMFAGDILTLDETGQVTRRNLDPAIVAIVRPRTSGGFVAVVENHVVLADAEGIVEHGPELWPRGGIRFNEGGCDPLGNLYLGSMAYDRETGAGSLYRLDAEGTITNVVDQVTISNGLGFSPDGSAMYYVDSCTRRIDVFDAAEGEITGRRPLVHLPEGAGNPDGLTVDAEGGIWVALYNGSAVHRYLPSGEQDAEIRLPASRVTSCTFGGKDLATLYITTSREGLAEGDEPLAGSIFSAVPGVRGLPVLHYAG